MVGEYSNRDSVAVAQSQTAAAGKKVWFSAMLLLRESFPTVEKLRMEDAKSLISKAKAETPWQGRPKPYKP